MYDVGASNNNLYTESCMHASGEELRLSASLGGTFCGEKCNIVVSTPENRGKKPGELYGWYSNGQRKEGIC